MLLRTLFQYKRILNDCQESNSIWIDDNNEIHFINNENTHHTYLETYLKESISYELPFERKWIKVFSGSFKVELTGSKERIFETKKIWTPLIIKRLSENRIFDLEFLLLGESFAINRRYLLNLPKDKSKFLNLL